MCDICHNTPCVSTCPNVDTYVRYCEECGEEIAEGYDCIEDIDEEMVFCDCVCFTEYMTKHSNIRKTILSKPDRF